MSRTLSKKVKLKTVNDLTGWDAAIYDAERAIEATKSRIESLTVSIHRFREFRSAGEPFPGGALPKRKSSRRKGNRAESTAG